MSASGKKIKKQYQDEMWKQRSGPMKTEFFGIVVRFYFGGKGKHDIDNFSKLIFDAGNGILWEDDGLIQNAYYEKWYDKKEPRIEVSIL